LRAEKKNHMPKPSGRVIFDTADLDHPNAVQPRRKISDVSVGDIMMQKT